MPRIKGGGGGGSDGTSPSVAASRACTGDGMCSPQQSRRSAPAPAYLGVGGRGERKDAVALLNASALAVARARQGCRAPRAGQVALEAAHHVAHVGRLLQVRSLVVVEARLDVDLPRAHT